MFPLGRAKLSGVFEKFLFYKRSLHSFGQRGAKCTPIFEIFQEKFFIYQKYSLTYLELQSQMTPYFTEKNEKIFFGCGCFILLAPKTPFTYSHWEKPNAHPKSQKIFYPFTYLELGCQNATCFSKKQKNFFEKTAYLKNFPSLVPTGRGHLGIVIPKKGKKICPPGVVGTYVFIKNNDSDYLL